MKAHHIEYSMRVMPHDQNTGGFFVAKFIKHGEVLFADPSSEEQPKDQKNAKDVKEAKQEYFKFEECDKEGCDRIFEYYGIDEVKKYLTCRGSRSFCTFMTRERES